MKKSRLRSALLLLQGRQLFSKNIAASFEKTTRVNVSTGASKINGLKQGRPSSYCPAIPPLFPLSLAFVNPEFFTASVSAPYVIERKSVHSCALFDTESGSILRRMSSTSADGEKKMVVDPFCFRQFVEKEASKSYSGTVFNVSIQEFEKVVNERFNPGELKPGYAPFCKHLFLVNDFTDARVNVLPITKENEHCLRTKYEARNEKELPVLARYFDRELLMKSSGALGAADKEVFPVAKYLDLILYSREQIEKENAAMGKASDIKEKAPWGIVSIKAQDIDEELPMTPITAMRNALGKDEGGSGVPLNRESYMAAFEYWKDHATVA